MSAPDDGVAATSRAGNATRWFAPGWTMLPLAARRCLVRNPLNGASMELSSGEYAVLAACEGCATLDAYESHAAQQLAAPPAHRPAIRELLERCARHGLLVSMPDLLARFGDSAGSSIGPIAGVTIPTADRPQLVLRLLTGASAIQRRSGAAYRWHVFDDSRSADNRRANRDAIAACPDLQVTYHDLSAADSLESTLTTAFPDLRQEIRSLLAAAGPGEKSCGRTMNHQFLWFAGRRFLSTDDDAMMDPRAPPLARPAAEVSLGSDSAVWYESFDAAFASCPELPLDPIAEHARWLGLPMRLAWRRAERESGGVRAGNLPAPAGPYFDPAARVIFTGNHVLGSPGWSVFSGQQLALDADTRAWLAANPEAARFAFESQVQWRGAGVFQLSPQATLSTTTLTGFDGTVLLPPGTRLGSEVDTLLGETARCVHPAAWTALLPFALPHVRDARRHWLSSTESYVLDPKRLLISYARLRSTSIRADDPQERLVTLGTIFVDLAAADEKTFNTLLEEQAADHAGRIVFSINEQLDDAATPATWKRILREWRASPLLRLDSASLRKQRESAGAARALALEYGRALMVWPRLWNHCRESLQ